MERREYALREALLKNSNETERWEAYKKENETAIQNLQEFSKHLSVEVMVPVGKKALMPGELIHTNEVLVGHYQGYFSKCSAHKAIEICELRLNQAKEHLNKLQAEEEFWQNKLDKPYLEGVLPNSNERDIIEEYDEDNEKRWREKHKEMLKRAKLFEKNEREQEAKKAKKISEEPKTDEDIFKMLEEAEMMEELEKELENLEIDEVSDEIIRKLISGEMEMPKEKARKANESKLIETIKETIAPSLNRVVKKIDHNLSNEKPPATNNNSRSNPEIQMDERAILSDEDNELTAEVQLIKEQAAFLPNDDQVGFYEYQVEIIRKKVAKVRMRNESDIDEKLHLLTVQSELEDLLALAVEEMDIDESGINESHMNLSDEQVENEDSTNKPKDAQQQKDSQQKDSQPKRRISFALANETLIFRDTEAVSQMLPKEDLIDKERETIKREIIALDNDDALRVSDEHIELQSFCDKKQAIIERVKKNRKFVAEEQSQVDSDLVTKIIDEADSKTKTIFITFKHSEQQQQQQQLAAEESDDDSSPNTLSEEIFIPGKPSDFYDLYLKQLDAAKENSSIQPSSIYLNGYVGEENVKAPILKEAYRQNAYEDQRSKFSVPNSDNDEDEESSIAKKSILRNKSAVEHETHQTNCLSSKKPRKMKASFDEGEYMSAYYKVMNEVIEKPPLEPDPLPQQKFIDAHAPKKRISRFKQSRTDIEKT